MVALLDRVEKAIPIAAAEKSKLSREPQFHLRLPLDGQGCGTQHEDPVQGVPSLKLRPNEPRFDGLPEPHLICDEKSVILGLNHLEHRLELVRAKQGAACLKAVQNVSQRVPQLRPRNSERDLTGRRRSDRHPDVRVVEVTGELLQLTGTDGLVDASDIHRVLDHLRESPVGNDSPEIIRSQHADIRARRKHALISER